MCYALLMPPSKTGTRAAHNNARINRILRAKGIDPNRVKDPRTARLMAQVGNDPNLVYPGEHWVLERPKRRI